MNYYGLWISQICQKFDFHLLCNNWSPHKSIDLHFFIKIGGNHSIAHGLFLQFYWFIFDVIIGLYRPARAGILAIGEFSFFRKNYIFFNFVDL